MAVVLCSEPFLNLARTQAKVLGVPDLPLLVIAHPLGGLAVDEVGQRALQALPQLLQVLRGTGA